MHCLRSLSDPDQRPHTDRNVTAGDRPSAPIAPDLMPPPTQQLSLLTGPALLIFLGGKLAQQALREIGQVSEELLRGDRLPTLTIPEGLTETSLTSSEPIDPPE